MSEYRFSDPVHMRMRADGSLRPETWRDRWASELAGALWPRAQSVVTGVCTESGTITLAPSFNVTREHLYKHMVLR